MIGKTNKFLILITLIYIGAEQPIIYHSLGNLHFSYQKWEFRYDLNLNDFYNISIALDECINKLKEICNTTKDKGCETFIQKANNFQTKIQIDVFNIKNLQRSKREPVTIALVLIGTTIMSLIATISVQAKALEKMRSELNENLKTIENLSETSKNMIEIQEDQIENLQKGFNSMSKQIANISNVINTNNEKHNIIEFITMTMIEHETIRNQILNIYSDNRKLQILNIIDLKQLMNEMEKINTKLLPNFTIPEINTLNSLSNIQNKIINTDHGITISYYFPIIETRGYTLFEITPIPFVKDNNIFIISENKTTFIIFNENIFSLDTNKTQCQRFDDNIIACNNIIEEFFEKASKCSISLIKSFEPTSCEIKELDRKNYITQTSDRSLHFTIIEPLLIKILCTHSEDKIELTESKTINFNEDCTIHKDTPGKSINGRSIFNINITLTKPNIHFFDRETHSWNESLVIIPKNELKFLEMKKNLDKIDTDLPIRHKTLEQIKIRGQSFDILEYFGLKKYFENIIIMIIIIIAGFTTIVCLIKCIIKKLFKC